MAVAETGDTQWFEHRYQVAALSVSHTLLWRRAANLSKAPAIGGVTTSVAAVHRKLFRRHRRQRLAKSMAAVSPSAALLDTLFYYDLFEHKLLAPRSRRRTLVVEVFLRDLFDLCCPRAAVPVPRSAHHPMAGKKF